MSYLSFYGLSSEPFSNAPVTRFYYESEQHKQALTRLLYAMQSMKGLAVVVGGIGTGKTTLARRLLDSLPDSEYEAALLVIIHSGVDAAWLLKRIAMQLGVVDPAQEKLALLSQLYQRLVQIYESGKKAVVLIDEAQMLATRELMEEFRGLLNLEVPERKLLSLVFFGLPELYQIMNLDPPLKQRVSLKFALEGLSRESTERYINHRLHLAGAQHALFTQAAIDVIYESTHGTPRLINTISDNALLEGYLSQAQHIDAPLVLGVVENLGIEVDEEHEQLPPPDASQPVTLSNPVPPSTAAKPAPIARPSAPTPAAAKPIAKPLVAKPAPTPRPAAPAVTPAAKPAPTPAPVPKASRSTVNLDEIDSLLAEIKKS